MGYFVRKIETAKWKQNDICHGEDISADAVTISLKTSGNCLSVWKIEKECDIQDAVLAIVSNSQHFDTIDIVMLDDKIVENKKLQTVQSPGITPFQSFQDNHYDIVYLTYNTLGDVADIIKSVFINKGERRFSRGEIKRIIINGIKSGKLNISDLNSSLKEKVMRIIKG